MSKVGAVLVVGGGIGGMQSALDLANSGFKVYLLEEKPAIGGVMAQLDKTFPTNDCSMCIMSPKLVDVGRHPNIELITYADLEEVTGDVGNFKIRVKKKAGFVDMENCTGCGECALVCPVNLASEFEEGLTTRNAIYKLYPQAIPNVFTIEKNGTSPCKIGCPASVNVHAYVALTSQGKFDEALTVVRRTLPFPSICGRTCHHPCESECNRKEIDEPIAIRPIKRFLIDRARENNEDSLEPISPDKDEKVAIVGAGPAGLACGAKLLEMGYHVTIFDSSPEPGGLMTNCLPDYRIPRDIAMYDVKRLLDHGLEVKSGVKIGRDITMDDLRKNHDAIFIAIGAQGSAPLDIQGVDLQGVAYGMDYLIDSKNGNKPDYQGKKVAVIGGGNVAIDCARAALRFGADVSIVYRRAREQMPAYEWEIEEAEEEGIHFHYLASPNKIAGEDGKAIGLECTKMELGEPDESGRRRPIPIEGSEFMLDIDTVIIAIGQKPETVGFEELKMTSRGTIEIDAITLQTNVPGIFAGGDITRGPASIIEAVADANEAVISIDRYLKGENLNENRCIDHIVADLPEGNIKIQHRINPTMSDVAERVSCFAEVEHCFTEEQAVAEASRCLNCAVCSECLLCVDACEANCITHDMMDTFIEFEVGSIILAPGFEKFNARLKSEYGYGRHANVITSLEFERVLSASGPFEGHVVRPSDRKEPKKIAWLQCVGSRDQEFGNNYCSSVCCTYAIKEAVIAKEHVSTIEPTIFFIDMRTFGKGFEAYYNRAKDEYGVRFIRCRISEINEDPITKNLLIKYETENGELIAEEFDLAVLSIGLQPTDGVRKLAGKLGVELNKWGFCKTGEFTPVETTRPGIMACGAFSGPKDIPETVMEASGAAAKAGGLISSERFTAVQKREYPPERDVSGEAPRIGVFICHCGINIGAYVDVPSLVDYAKTLPYVVYAEENLYTCSQDTQKKIVEAINEHGLNRVIVSSCTPRTHEPLFQETIREAGLNPHLFEMANIRDQCSWVHMNNNEIATSKAADLIRMAVAKAKLKQPLPLQTVEIIQKGLVIGGGLAGMISALSIAEQGFPVHLVEKEKQLGGNLRNIHFTLDSDDVHSYMNTLINEVENEPLITVHKDARINEVKGFIGNFVTTLGNEAGSTEINSGIIIVATGAEESKPKEYLYGTDERVVTQLGFEKMISDGQDLGQKTIVMIQCVGSREKDRPYCSRVCCADAVKNSIRTKKRHPDAQVFILYRDMRTYGFKEEYYEKARELGVIFIRYDEGDKPVVTKGADGIEVLTKDHILSEPFLINADVLVLSSAIVPRADTEELAQMLKVPLNEDRFFLEAHVKLKPVDFATEGIFLAGMAHSPKTITETISQAYAAASRATTIISMKEHVTEATIASVTDNLCSGCGLCVEACPYSAIELTEKGIANVNSALCKGCGLCNATCRSGAIQQHGFTDHQMLFMIKGSLNEMF
ncbi:MAG: FAD-dependent oxidoreductase [Thermoplasmata archaeon]|nr:FAD-dependent oxidoreductase [Thermoplasmata archaeon]